uniref:Putative 7.8 kDa acidic protein n=1 Tax=Aedes aegypti TaxID=7159 RepID=A0A0P6IW51_AEDAE
MSYWRNNYIIFIAVIIVGSQLTAWAESDVEKYCKYLDCKGGRVKMGESFAATKFAFGYCTCGEENGKVKMGESFAATKFAFGYCTCGEENGKKYTRYFLPFSSPQVQYPKANLVAANDSPILTLPPLESRYLQYFSTSDSAQAVSCDHTMITAMKIM